MNHRPLALETNALPLDHLASLLNFTSFRISAYFCKISSFVILGLSKPNFPGKGALVPVAITSSVYFIVCPFSSVTVLFFESKAVALDFIWQLSSLAANGIMNLLEYSASKILFQAMKSEKDKANFLVK